MSELKDTFITVKCAHRFCEECIKKSIEEFHKCPLCNHLLTLNDVIKDTQFDSIKEDISVLKRQKMNDLLNTLTESTRDGQNFEISPLETVLKS